MPHAAAMVCHGGFGTVRMALASGVPMVVLPLFADQPHNARRVAALGAGIALERGPAGVAELAEAVEVLLDDASYRAAAARVEAEVRTLPPVDGAPYVLRGLLAA
jgi:UDP:flavonoid glycosyltransferase YjiC (YdhE family)